MDNNEEQNPNRNIISAKVYDFRFMPEDPGSPDSRRLESLGIDKIEIIEYDRNFGRMKISVLSDVESENNYFSQPDGNFQS